MHLQNENSTNGSFKVLLIIIRNQTVDSQCKIIKKIGTSTMQTKLSLEQLPDKAGIPVNCHSSFTYFFSSTNYVYSGMEHFSPHVS